MLHMSALGGLRDAASYSACLNVNCDSLTDDDAYLACSQSCQQSTSGSGQNYTPLDPAFDACVAGCTGDDACLMKCAQIRYGSSTTVTKVPGGVVINNPSNIPSAAGLPLCSSVTPGTPCFHPTPATNWWIVGALSALGVLAAVGTVIAIRRHAHAA